MKIIPIIPFKIICSDGNKHIVQIHPEGIIINVFNEGLKDWIGKNITQLESYYKYSAPTWTFHYPAGYSPG
jgi:hypothetical protein